MNEQDHYSEAQLSWETRAVSAQLRSLRPINLRSTTFKKSHEQNEKILTRLIFKLGESLGSFRSAVQALLNGAERDPQLQRELLAGMDAELRELQRVLDNVVQWKAIEGGGFRLRTAQISPTSWLRTYLAQWQAAAAHKTLMWTIDIPEDLPQLVVDVERVAQALDNLLADSTGHAPHGSVISFQSGQAADMIWIRLQSPAPHLQDSDYGRLFEPFYAGREYGRFPGRMGLGLQLARLFIVAHGGRLDLEPPEETGGDLIFYLWLPTVLSPTRTG